ncbi:superinfection immunity protein [Leptospira meyeri]|uniref:superinfection immunity protein n=1 Tax=Leptospira meyeri TaxID=29508 RepID=UPI00108481CE|nr:superinfection immunity protein [Leptospira meyeri]TGM60090.1 superinfection immunity protein [Leptospira meyeri]TGM62974.1 superinfection immunity protein [Leptospira meyeri]
MLNNLGTWEILFLLSPIWLIGGYMLPTIISLIKKKQSNKLVLINLLLGWTIIGWFYALVLALKKNT